jgi:hypothetical protein
MPTTLAAKHLPETSVTSAAKHPPETRRNTSAAKHPLKDARWQSIRRKLDLGGKASTGNDHNYGCNKHQLEAPR